MGCTCLSCYLSVPSPLISVRFLLAQLYLNSLIGKRSLKVIRIALEKFPEGSDAYDHAYNEAMERIEGQVSDSQKLAKQVLAWITCAKRPLTTLELQYAFAVEIGESTLDQENLPEIEDMVSICAGLVTIDEESDIIRLVHYTTQEYFERTQRDWFPDVQRDIVTTCATYLSFDVFKTGFCLTDKEFEARLRLNPFYDYAARNWGHHVRAASTEVEQLILDFLKNEAKVSASSQVLTVSEKYRYGNYSQEMPKNVTGIYLAAYFGLEEITSTLLKKGYQSDCKDTYDRTPLSLAAGKGHEAVVRLLAERDDVEVNSKDRFGQTPLSLTAAKGHEAVVKLLLASDHVDPDSKDTEYGRTPLSWAAANGHEAVVRLLVERDDVEADSNNTKAQTPLSLAATNGHEAVVRLLAERDDVEVDSKDQDGQTPLSLAAVKGHEAVVKLLVDRADVDADSKDNVNRTPLLHAAWHGHEAVVKLLVARDDVAADSKDEFGQTPLSWAAWRGRKAVVKLLVDRDDVEADSKNDDGQTPLSRTAGNGHEAVTKLLLAKGAVDPNSKDNDGRTPLSSAAAPKPWMANWKQKAVVELLLANNRVDVNTKDMSGRAPLSWAAGDGHCARVKLLLAKNGIDRDSKDDLGRTPLWWAAANGHEKVMKLLLTTDGVDPDPKDSRYGRTPLSYAAGLGHEAVVKLLLAKDVVDLDSKDRYGRTPLLLSARNGYEVVVKLLLAKDVVNPDSKDKFGRTPLSWAVRRGNSHVVKLLLENYEKNGILVREDVSIATPPAGDHPGRIICETCMLRIPDVDIHYHCVICSDGDFDLCQECVTSGAFCFDQSHRLIKRTFKDNNFGSSQLANFINERRCFLGEYGYSFSPPVSP
jgi:ankyrin repeat protein